MQKEEQSCGSKMPGKEREREEGEGSIEKGRQSELGLALLSTKIPACLPACP